MTTQVYEVMTKISMVNGVSAVLATIGKDVLQVEGSIGRLSNSLAGLDKVGRAVAGGLAALGGMAVIGGLKALTDQAGALSHQLVQIQKLGIDGKQFDQARAAAFALHNQVAGATSVDALKIYGATFSMFGHEGSLKVMKPLAEFAQVMGNTSGNYEKAFDNLYDLVRGGELMGKFLNEATHTVDVEKLQHFLELGSKVVQATHGRVDAKTWFGLAQQGGPALSQLSDDGLLTMAIASQAMGGMRAGTALTSFYQQMVGGKMTQYAASILKDYGLVGGYTVGRGGHLTWDPGALNTAFVETMKRDPLLAVDMLRKAMEGHGLTTLDQQVPQLFQVLGRQTTQRLVHDLLRNEPQIMQERARVAAGMGTGAAKRLQDSQDYVQVEHNYEAAKTEMLQHLGLPMMRFAIPVMKQMTALFDKIADWAKANPRLLENLGKGFAALGAAAVTGGLGLMVGGVGGGLIGAFAGAVGTLVALNWNGLNTGLAGFVDKMAGRLADALQAVVGWMDKLSRGIDAVAGAIASALEKIMSWASKLAGAISAIGGLFSKINYTGGGFGGGGIVNASYGSMSAEKGEVADYIRRAATARGIDPNVALRVAASEGLHTYVGDSGSSFGPFQLHYGGIAGGGNAVDGLGDVFTKQTGLNARDRSTWRSQVDFALDHAKKNGWGAWHGWKGHPRAGLGGFAPPSRGSTVNVHNVMHLDGEVVHRSVTRRIIAAATHSRQAPYFNGTGMFSGPDQQFAVG